MINNHIYMRRQIGAQFQVGLGSVSELKTLVYIERDDLQGMVEMCRNDNVLDISCSQEGQRRTIPFKPSVSETLRTIDTGKPRWRN